MSYRDFPLQGNSQPRRARTGQDTPIGDVLSCPGLAERPLLGGLAGAVDELLLSKREKDVETGTTYFLFRLKPR